MTTDPEFDPDLYRGTAELYDRFRLPYAAELINRLLDQVRAIGTGRALDLGCGTGQLAFALADAFAEVWAIDQEPDMISMVATKIAHRGSHNVRAVVAGAENLDAPAESFDLIVIGNAFHRMPRQRVARRIRDWLKPGGFLALCWSGVPWWGDEPWKGVFDNLLKDWSHKLDADNRVPANLSEARTARPDEEILRSAGLVDAGGYEVTVAYDWRPATLAGFTYATSFLPVTIFGDRTAEFEADLAERLQPYLHDGVVTDNISYAYELFSRPAPADT